MTEELQDLTLDGTTPDLLRKCAPVLVDGKWRGVIIERDERPAGHRLGDWIVQYESTGPCPPDSDPERWGLTWSVLNSRIVLVLDDATGRDIAARWLARKIAKVEAPIAAWVAASALSGFNPVYYRLHVATMDNPAGTSWPLPVGVLQGLDANSSRRLSDGSYWADAAALCRVIRNEATKAVT